MDAARAATSHHHLKLWGLRAVVALSSAVVVAAAVVAPGHQLPVAAASPGETPAAPCVDGITPLDPYANICSIPYRPPRVRGSAPDQTALLNCSVGSQIMQAWCLSQFVNGGSGGSGGFGGFGGVVLGPGIRP